MKKASLLFLILFLFALPGLLRPQEIIEAVKGNDLAKVKTLVEANRQLVAARDETGRTPLHWACRGVHFDLLRHLVEKGADVNVQDNNGVAPLHSLATRAHLDGIRFLLAHRADVNIRTKTADTPLHYAALSGNAVLAKALLDSGGEPSVRNANGDTPLSIAVLRGSREMVDLLLDRKAEIDLAGPKATLMLQAAARTGLERIFQWIMEKEGERPFAGKEINRQTLQNAILGGSVPIVKLLLGKGMTLEKEGDVYGWTPVHYAASMGQAAMVEFLVQQGIDIRKKTRAGETAYNLAEASKNKEAQSLVIRLGGSAEPWKFPVLKGDYLGQKPPGTTPEIFAPGIISTSAHEFSTSLSPDGDEFYFTRRRPDINNNVVMCSRRINGVWTEPAVAPFAQPFTFEASVTPDNKRIYFQSGRVVAGALQMFTLFVDRTEKGWGEVQDPGAPFNPGNTMHISATLDGTLYTTDISGGFTSRVNNAVSGPGQECLGMLKMVNGRYERLERLGPPLDKLKLGQHPWIAPDESTIAYTVRRPGQHPASVLFCSFREKDGNWSEPRELKLGIEAGQPFVSMDGKYLFFTSSGPGEGDVYWVSAKVLDGLRPTK